MQTVCGYRHHSHILRVFSMMDLKMADVFQKDIFFYFQNVNYLGVRFTDYEFVTSNCPWAALIFFPVFMIAFTTLTCIATKI